MSAFIELIDVSESSSSSSRMMAVQRDNEYAEDNYDNDNNNNVQPSSSSHYRVSPTNDTNDEYSSIPLSSSSSPSFVEPSLSSSSPSDPSPYLSLNDRCRSFLHRMNPYHWHPLSGWQLLIVYAMLTAAQEMPVVAVGLILNNELKFQPDETPQYYAATFVPWTIRPIYGFLSDQLPLFSYRRRPYFIICGCGAILMQVSLAIFGVAKSEFVMLAVATQVFVAFSEVVIDSLSVERGNDIARRVERVKKIRRIEKRRYQSENGNSHNVTTVSGTADATMSTSSAWSAPLLVNRTNGEHSFAHIIPVSIQSSSSSSSSPRDSLPTIAAVTPFSSSAFPPLLFDSPDDDSILTPPSSSEVRTRLTLSHLISSTPDLSLLTSVMIKSRIQSECMSVRSFGSFVSSAVSIILLLLFTPRTVVMCCAGAFVLGMVFIFRVNEKKVLVGHFYLVADAEEEAEKERMTKQTKRWREEGGEQGTEEEREDERGSKNDVVNDNNGATLRRNGENRDSLLNVPSSSSSLSDSDASSAPLSATSTPRSPPLTRLSFVCSKFFTLYTASRHIILPLLFIFLLNVTPSAGDAYSTYVYTQCDFINWQYGMFSFIGLGGALVGCLVYERTFARCTWSMKRIFVVTSAMSFIVGFIPILLATKRSERYIDDQSFIIIDSLISSVIGSISGLPAIVLASHYAPRGIGLEALMFSLFAATAHVGALVSTQLSAELTRQLGISRENWNNLWMMIVICNVVGIAPLMLMPCLLKEKKEKGDDEEEEDKEKGEGTETNEAERNNDTTTTRS